MSLPKLLLLSPLPPPAGGIASWTLRLLSSKLIKRYEVHIINTNVGDAIGSPLRQFLDKARYGRDSFRQLRRELRVFKPDIVHINTSGTVAGLIRDLAFMAIAKEHGAKTVLHFRGGRFAGNGIPNALMPLAVRGVRQADLVLALNRTILGELQQHRIENAQLISGLIPARDPIIRSRAQNSMVSVLYVGWVTPTKGLVELLEAIADVPNVRLTILGRFVDIGGKDSAALAHSTVARLALSDRVFFAGEVSLAEVWEHYAQADIFTLPSWSEGFPNALLESMMAGLPSVVTAVGAMPEAVVHGETGLLVPVRDRAALASAIQRLADSPEMRAAMGQAARERVMRCYEAEAVLGKLGDYYDDLRERATE